MSNPSTTFHRNDKFRTSLLLAGAAVCALPSLAHAQAAAADESAAASGDIIVTARRSDEKLQDVPITVQVIGGAEIQKKAITDFTEITKLSPGLVLENTSSAQKIVLRGVAWAPGSGTPATPVYLNEVPFDPGTVFNALFDVGQVEVLRGPQGTTRGAPSISGAITITTRHPDLKEFGGYVQGQYGEGHHSDIQGAINVPLVKDMLAVRVAANVEDSRGDRVYSVNSKVTPLERRRTVRATALFKPTDTLRIEAMFEHRWGEQRFFTPVVGTGSPGALASATLGAIRANFNGLAIGLLDRRSVMDAPSVKKPVGNLLTVNATWDVLGQQLNYIYGKQWGTGVADRSAQDSLNFLPGYEPISVNQAKPGTGLHTHEVRLSSIRAPGRFFDYDIGYYGKRSNGGFLLDSFNFFEGSFGAPGTLPGVVTTPNTRYALPIHTDIQLGQVYDSFYGNLTLHLGEKTEFSGGVRHIKDRIPVTLKVTSGAASIIVSPLAALGGLPCPGIPGVFVTGLVDSAYPGYCDFNLPALAGANINEPHNDSYKATIYNFSLSHRFSDSVLVYASTGSSYRSGLPALGNEGLPANLLVPLPERAKSYELGVKTSWGRRLTVNASIFQIDYKDQLTTFENVAYRKSTDGNIANTSQAFYRNIDSRIRGFELELAAKPTDNLSLGANISYSKIKSRGGQVPCNAATPLTAANPINFCTSLAGETLNQNAPFQASLSGDYTVPIGAFDGYFRFNLNYQGENPNYTSTIKVPGYALVDLFAGLKGEEAGWELGLYAKNVFNVQKELQRVTLQNNIYGPYAVAPAGYYQSRLNTPREIGVTLRYAFGSR